jgi:hypothetical protein
VLLEDLYVVRVGRITLRACGEHAKSHRYQFHRLHEREKLYTRATVLRIGHLTDAPTHVLAGLARRTAKKQLSAGGRVAGPPSEEISVATVARCSATVAVRGGSFYGHGNKSFLRFAHYD